MRLFFFFKLQRQTSSATNFSRGLLLATFSPAQTQSQMFKTHKLCGFGNSSAFFWSYIERIYQGWLACCAAQQQPFQNLSGVQCESRSLLPAFQYVKLQHLVLAHLPLLRAQREGHSSRGAEGI